MPLPSSRISATFRRLDIRSASQSRAREEPKTCLVGKSTELVDRAYWPIAEGRNVRLRLGFRNFLCVRPRQSLRRNGCDRVGTGRVGPVSRLDDEHCLVVSRVLKLTSERCVRVQRCGRRSRSREFCVGVRAGRGNGECGCLPLLTCL